MAEKKVKGISLWLVPIVALGFASTQLSWSLFNNVVPLMLQDNYGISLAWVGFIMTWDNILAFFIQPAIGSLSDKTKTRIGKRMPFIVPGIILGSVLFYGIFLASKQALWIFLSTIVLFNLSMALYRSPTVSLLPDVLKSEDRTLGNGIVNLVGGVFSGVSLFVGGGMLAAGNTQGAFLMVSVGMILSLIILFSVIKEKKYDLSDVVIEKDNVFTILKREFKRMVRAEDKSMLFMLLAIFFWFVAWNALEAFYSTYVHRTFVPELSGEEASGVASGVMFIFPVVFVVFTLVGGILGKKYGRSRTMKIGLAIMTLAIFLGSLIQANSFLGLTMDWKNAFKIIFAIAGTGWGLVNVNSIVVIWELAVDNGTGTGFYYAFASAAAITGPTVMGLILDININFLFPFSITFLVIAFITLFFVKSGEAGEKDGMLSDALAEITD